MARGVLCIAETEAGKQIIRREVPNNDREMIVMRGSYFSIIRKYF